MLLYRSMDFLLGEKNFPKTWRARSGNQLKRFSSGSLIYVIQIPPDLELLIQSDRPSQLAKSSLRSTLQISDFPKSSDPKIS